MTNMMHAQRFVLYTALLSNLLWMVFSTRLGLQEPAHAAEPNDVASIISELVAIVEKHGRATDMGRICVALKLVADGDCRFKQIAVSEQPAGTVDNYAINVPVGSAGAHSFVLMFHIHPLVGNFFVVSRDGRLLTSFFRVKGVDYTEISTEDARPAFAKTLAFWKRNLPKLKELIAINPPPRK